MPVSRLDACFQRLREQQRKALIPFITAGDPSLEATVPVMHALVEAGADVIELGVPFSDPMADGPTIQRSSERALARGAGSRYVLQAVAQFRERDAQTPVVLMGYLNPVEIHGYAAFAKAAVDAGVDGVLLVDLPPEEAGEAQQAFDAAGLALVLLASPTTSEARADKLLALARGYLYYVSFAGVTGASERLDSDAASARLQALRARASVPVVAGFGIKDAASAAAMARQADGVVVGSALVAVLAEAGSAEEAAQRAGAFLAPLRQARPPNGASRPPAGIFLTATCKCCRPAAGTTHGSARRGCRPAAGTTHGSARKGLPASGRQYPWVCMYELPASGRHDPAPKRTSQHGFFRRLRGRQGGARAGKAELDCPPLRPSGRPERKCPPA